MGVVLAACMCVAKHFPSHASLSSDTRGSKCQSVIAQQQKYITPRSVHTPRLSLTHALTRGAARPTRMCWLSNNPMSELCHTRLCACLTAWMDPWCWFAKACQMASSLRAALVGFGEPPDFVPVEQHWGRGVFSNSRRAQSMWPS